MAQPRPCKLDFLSLANGSLHDPDVGDRTAIVVIVRIENHRLQYGIGITRGRRNLVDNRIKQAINTDTCFRADANAFVGVCAQRIHHFLSHFVRPSMHQVDLVDHRHDGQFVFHRRIGVGDGLRFNPLKRIDQKQSSFTARKRT